MAVTTLQQAIKRLEEAKTERKALAKEIDHLRHLVADLSSSPLKRDLRERNRNIYLDWEKGKSTGKTMHWLDLTDKYNLGPDQLRLIYKQQSELVKMRRAGG